MKLHVDVERRLRSHGRVFDLHASFDCVSDVTVIFGASGSGKSVTMQTITGLVRPDHGCVRLGDRILFDSARGIDLPTRERRVGYVFQDYALFPHLTVAQNVAFPLTRWWQRRVPPALREKVQDMLDLFEIRHLAESYPAQLSGGQRQRLALARALVGSPDLILLDEPFSALDPLLRERMRHELLRFQAKFAVPMLVITHDPDDVATLAQDVIVFREGRVIEAGSIASVLADVESGPQVRRAMRRFLANITGGASPDPVDGDGPPVALNRGEA